MKTAEFRQVAREGGGLKYTTIMSFIECSNYLLDFRIGVCARMISIIVIEIANVSNASRTITIVVFQLIILVSHVRELWIILNIGNE